MTQATHSPGPWRITTDFIAVYDDQARRIANMDSDGAPDFGEDETLANARLIAAAPELLAALETLLWQVERTDDLPEEVEEMLADARAAIAKARGETI